jgi:hypothetical protein
VADCGCREGQTIERLHKTMCKERFSLHDRQFAPLEQAQAALDG